MRWRPGHPRRRRRSWAGCSWSRARHAAGRRAHAADARPPRAAPDVRRCPAMARAAETTTMEPSPPSASDAGPTAGASVRVRRSSMASLVGRRRASDGWTTSRTIEAALRRPDDARLGGRRGRVRGRPGAARRRASASTRWSSRTSPSATSAPRWSTPTTPCTWSMFALIYADDLRAGRAGHRARAAVPADLAPARVAAAQDPGPGPAGRGALPVAGHGPAAVRGGRPGRRRLLPGRRPAVR